MSLSIISVVLTYIATKIADKITEDLLDKGADKLERVIKGEKSQNAFKRALGDAIQRYSTYGTRLVIAEPLLRNDGLLADEVVIQEISKIFRFEGEPNYVVIGERWKSLLNNPPAWRDFTDEAKILIDYLRDELKTSDVFGPVFERQSINAIAENVLDSADALTTVLRELTQLRQLMDGRLGDLMRTIMGASTDIRENIRDFTGYIDEKTQNFVGRNFVFESIDSFLLSTPSGYFIIKGDPGIGKSALLCELVKRKGYIHHFNNRALSINTTDIFLKNVCSQLIAVYGLKQAFLPAEATKDGGFLLMLLEEISRQLGPGQKAVIVIDALDEVDEGASTSSANILCLPPNLPKGIYVILSCRRVDIRIRIECDQRSLEIEQDTASNLDDIRSFVSDKTDRNGIKAYISAQEIDQELFIEHLIEKSQGNFMYLRYVLPEIENGYYKDLALSQLPIGLLDYYEDHWRRMRKKSELDWLEYKLPVVIALSIVKEPVSISLISEFSGVKDLRRIRAVLLEWKQFLYESKVVQENSLQIRYRAYHDTFREFIALKDEVADEHVSLKKAHGIIADVLWNGLFPGDELHQRKN